MKRIHVIGRKNNGKTTLVVELVERLCALGYRVGTIKHTHHRHELDVPGKDSYRHREAGAVAVGILSPGMNAVFWPTPATPPQGEAPPADKYSIFESLFAELDLVLVEGDSRTDALKIEVWRSELADVPLATSDPSIYAVVSDSPCSAVERLWPRSNLAALATRIVELVTPR